MVVTPSEKVLPEAGPAVCVMEAPPQLSLTVGAVQVATALQAAPALRMMFPGQLAIRGAWVSLTVTLKEQVGAVPELQVTVVVPTGKNELEAGEQVIVPQSPVLEGENATMAPH